MSKINFNAQSKLSSTAPPIEEKKKNVEIPDKILPSRKLKEKKINTFYLKSKDQIRFEELLLKAQNMTDKKITLTDVLRGLLIANEEIDENILISCIQKSFVE